MMILKNKDLFKKAFIAKTHSIFGKGLEDLTNNEAYQVLAQVIRDCISENWIKTRQTYVEARVKQVYYFSIEFLLGKLLNSNLTSYDIQAFCAEALSELGFNLPDLIEEETDAGLGNGGLGRLAACYIDSMAAMELPGNGCSIRYKYGLFEQKIMDNQQVELPDNWLRNGFAWEIRQPDKAITVKFGGNAYMKPVESGTGELECVYENYSHVTAVPYDVPIVGYHNNTVNTLRLWRADFTKDTLFNQFKNYDDYRKVIQYKNNVQRISEFLYPEGDTSDGQQLRLTQEYFLVSAGIQSILRFYKKKYGPLTEFADKIAIHINDTHPSLVIPELMRIFMDEENFTWDEAWAITTKTVAYTNHTIMPEALERWSALLMKDLLPRMYLIIEEINRRLLENVRKRYPHNEKIIAELAILWDKEVYMARLAVVGSHSVNGVAKIHSHILKTDTLRYFNTYYPGKFNNKTNGVTHRRWLIEANPPLAHLIDNSVTPQWRSHPEKLIGLLKYADDASFQSELARIKANQKEVLAKYIYDTNHVIINPASIFDVQIKRIHMYKRQLLNILHIMYLYNQLKANPSMSFTPRTFIFAGKAAASYYSAKMIIKLINVMGDKINNDKAIGDKLKVVFLENYCVTLGELVFPAADVSEQISTASKEASGTGNMKFMMNGAITLGTMDGANVEIHERVGDDNCVIFGLRAEEVISYYTNNQYLSWDIYREDDHIRTVLDQLINGFFPKCIEDFRVLYDALLYHNDEFFVLKDFESYRQAQLEMERRYKDQAGWRRSCIVNIAHSGVFSSDRAISEYAHDIWHIKPITVRNNEA